MARIRTIKPDFFRHHELFLAEKETGLPLRVAFAGLWTTADREGRFRWRPEQLKLDCLPFDDVDFSRVLDALATRGFLVRTRERGADGSHDFGVIPSWRKHQAINPRERPSDLPDPKDCEIIQYDADASSTRGDACTVMHVHARGEGERELTKNSVPNGTGAPRQMAGEGSPRSPESVARPAPKPPPDSDPKAEYFRRGRVVLGKQSGAILAKLLRHFGCEDDLKVVAHARAAIEQASTKAIPVEWVGRILAGQPMSGDDDKFLRAML